jgi:hypothetical protein
VSTTVAAFEVLRFEAVPAAAGVALLELEGVFAVGPAPAKPRLLLEYGGRSRELPAVVAGGDPHAWSATFAVPIEALDGDQHAFALVPGRGPVIGLPAPDLAGGEDDRFVRLARSANDLRHRLAEASASAATSSERYAEIAEERDRLAAELESTRSRAGPPSRRRRRSAPRARRPTATRPPRARSSTASASGWTPSRPRSPSGSTPRPRAPRRQRPPPPRADAALRGPAEVERLHEEVSAAADEADALHARVVAAENEAQATRLELREARSRLQNLQRDRPGRGARRGPPPRTRPSNGPTGHPPRGG